MTEVEILTDAWALIEPPERWCQGPVAMTATGADCDPESPEAVRWCAWGAVLRTSAGDWPAYFRALSCLNRAARELGATGAIDLNETRDHATVRELYTRAIALAEQGASRAEG